MSKNALVTGGSRGIGATITRHLVDNNWEVLVHYHSSSENARELNNNPSIQVARADLSKKEGVEKLAQKTIVEFESLHLLVNNAARFKKTPLAELSFSDWEKHMSINARAPLFLTRELATKLRNSSGSVINILDWSTRSPFPAYPAYMASKGALETLTRGLAKTLAPAVRVNGIAPGAIEFPENFPEDQKDKIIEKTLIERQGTKTEVAEAVLFLAEKATFSTGSILEIDGGRHIN